MTSFSPVFDAPAALKDVARTFSEPDVTLSHAATEVANGSVRLSPPGTTFGASASSFADDASDTGASGWEFTAKAPISSVDVTPESGGSGIKRLQLVRVSDSTVLDEQTTSGDFTGNSRTLTPPSPLSTGERYRVLADGNGASYQPRQATTLPSDNQVLESIVGVNPIDESTSPDYVWAFSSVSVAVSGLSGSVTVEWPTPADVYAWDLAQLQRSVDGETVDVFVEANDGSGWTEIAGPIARGAPIDADAASNVRFRVEIARSNSNNDPTLDMVARRFKL